MEIFTHQSRTAKNEYPLVQIGPGLLTLNTTDENYFWNDFYNWSETLVNNFFEVFTVDNETFKPNLLYLDFFKFDFKNRNVNEFINDSFNINYNQGFINGVDNPYNLDIGYFYETKLGNLSVTLKRGRNSNKEEGIIMQSSLHNMETMTGNKKILSWLNNSHEFISQLFKDITKGNLYESFK